MKHNNEDFDRRAAIAEKFGLLTEQDWQLLSGATAGTVEAWRKRGVGPDSIRIGNCVYYPAASMQKHIDGLQQKKKAYLHPDLYPNGDD